MPHHISERVQLLPGPETKKTHNYFDMAGSYDLCLREIYNYILYLWFYTLYVFISIIIKYICQCSVPQYCRRFLILFSIRI